MKEKAIKFEKLGKSRTFFVCDSEAEKVVILGYFTLALRFVDVPESYSNRKIAKLDGFSSKANNVVISQVPVILIGQFGKDTVRGKGLRGEQLMEHCFDTLLDGQKILGGRVLLIECKPVPYLLEFYGSFGFQQLNIENNSGQSQLQLYRILEENEIM